VRAQELLHHPRRRRLAVRPDDVDRGQARLRLAELEEERTHPLRAEAVVRPRREALEPGDVRRPGHLSSAPEELQLAAVPVELGALRLDDVRGCVPDEPLVAARSERMRAHGDDPFGDYLLPEAVLRFKQGFGRLIRSRTDRGAVLLLDSRLGERGYGAAFRNALPVRPELHRDAGDLVARVVGWLEGAS